MGNRWYEQQGRTITKERMGEYKPKPKRKLKKDFIAEINKILGTDISGLDKCTIATLTQLLEAIENA